MQTIIVATNFSKDADNALNFAIKALKGKNYQIVLFNFFSPSIHVLNARLPADKLDRLTFIRKEILQDMVDSISKNHEIPAIPYFATGDFITALTSCIKLFDAKLIILGMAEKSLGQDLLGNTTTMIINKVKCPILSIPSNVSYKGITKVLFACDIDRGVHKKVLENVREFAHNFGATVDIFHVNKYSNRPTEPTKINNILEFLSDTEATFIDVHAESVINAIEKEIKSSDADILIMIPYKYGFWNSIIHRSLTRKMASASNIPLLSIQL
ncbi:MULTISPECIES: universal stress protein [Sphingobacterium]|uniref:universal stress protein n=1 Tax=Sphingobacterium TaxID=28453 RepID=UPI00104BD433|nr:MULTISPECIES: universal stress protein [Sphingobacterium]MCW2263060.1 nucleotide-binding universal stress UspA family protein [Sphingobacterium kitahiroshimense]TCR11950.1 nucleotide-binding universal stress UspA family protein [Sphingobacterium sp. JUb78]